MVLSIPLSSSADLLKELLSGAVRANGKRLMNSTLRLAWQVARTRRLSKQHLPI